MNDRYQQQQAQQYQQFYGNNAGGGGGYNNPNNNNYPMQYPMNNNAPPIGSYGYGTQQQMQMQPPTPPQGRERMRGGSFDAANMNRSAPFGMDPAMMGNYGAIPPPPSRPRTSSKEFSAMNELSSVIGGSQRGPGLSSSQRGSSRGLGASPKSNRHRRTMSDSGAMGRGMAGGAAPMPTLYQGMVMPNPDYQPNSSRMRADSYGSQGSYHSHSMPVGAGPNGIGVYMGNTGGSGEMEAFLAAQMGGGVNGGGGNIKGSGRPKTHMRQHSVNLYMKTFKGTKQSRGCKDVLYAILFVVQLATMAFVGFKFGPEALVPTSAELGPGKGLDDDSELEPIVDGEDDEKVVLAYQNIVKMAYTCGAFAIIVSALALAFMMAMSRRLVYVALVLSIGVSFAWGTIGIGISPKSFVPITGIIALMLTVGYMFVVWDRIPFASANLTTALTGVRDNLGLVGVAFFFQFLALVCSIYYSFTFVGLHDALQNGEMIDLPDHVKTGIMILLMISYYWTYQVLRVCWTILEFLYHNNLSYNAHTLACTRNFTDHCHGHMCRHHWELVVQHTL